VAVRICSIECCFTHPLAECNEVPPYFKKDVREGVSLQQDMADWSKICRRMHVWDYTTEFRHYLNPLPNFFVLQPNIKFFIENGVTGLFEQGNRESVSGECGELRAYLISKLMWNPDLNVNQAMNEFLCGYYGQAGAPIREYIDILARHVKEHHVHMGIFDNPTQGHIPDHILQKAIALWDKAERLADNDEILARVQCSRMQIRYVQINRMEPGIPGREEKVERFIEDLHRFGFIRTREARPLEISIQQIREGTTNSKW
jgi:hypothetical protein